MEQSIPWPACLESQGGSDDPRGQGFHLHPRMDAIEGGPRSDVVNNYGSVGSFEVSPRNRPEFLMASSVPQLDHESLEVSARHSVKNDREEVHSNRRFLVWIERI